MKVSITNFGICVVSDAVLAAIACEKRRKLSAVKKRGYDRLHGKSLRDSGQGYKSTTTGNIVEARVIGPPCESRSCKKSKNRFCNELTHSMREEQCHEFWGLNTMAMRKVRITGLTQVNPVHRLRARDESVSHPIRARCITYFLMVGNERKQVCKYSFLSTLSLSEGMLRDLVLTSSEVLAEREKRATLLKSKKEAAAGPSKPPTRKELFVAGMSFARRMLKNLKKCPSHWCRHDTSKLYLQGPFSSMRDVYRWV